MKKIKTLFPIFLGILLMFSLFIIPSINATSYYNHLRNPSFLSASDYIEDGSFESGDFETGMMYGNWSSFSGSPEYVTDYPKTGIYAMHLDYTNDYVMYNFTDSYLAEDILSFTGWIRCSTASSSTMYVFFYYDDDTNSSLYYTDMSETVYKEVDFLSPDSGSLTGYKKVVAFYVYSFGSINDLWLDNFVFMVDDGGGQDDITDSSTPWFHGTTPPLISPHIYGYIGINSTFGRLDNSSGYIGHLDSRGTIQQNVDLLYTDYIHFFDLYYYVNICNDIEIKINIVYSDGSYDVKIKALTVNATWTYLNYGISFIDSDKYITKITIGLTSYTSEIVYLDDIGLWASVPITYRRFVYEISPYPIMKTTSFFNVYMGIQYTMYCYLYNVTGYLSESGNYTITDLTGVTSGSFTDGTFSYVLTARNYKVDFQEYISISIVTEDEILVFQILAIWNYVPSDVVKPISPTETSNFMFLFIFIVIPSMFLSVILKRVGIPIIGFLSGLTIMSAIGRAVGIIDLWFLFVMVLVCILIILSMMKRGIYT